MNGPLPITWESIKAYCDMRRIEQDDDLEFIVVVIPQLDDIWMTDWYKQSEARQKLKKT